MKKIQKRPGDIILLHTCTINGDHMIHGSWDIRHNRAFCRFGPYFALLTPLTNQKIEILKKCKKHLEIPSFYTSVPKIIIICYTVPEIWRVTDVIIFFILGYFLPFYPDTPLNSPKNQTFKKMKKASGDIIILRMCTKNYDHMIYSSWDIVCDRRTDRRMDRKTEKVTYRWVLYLKK